MTRIEAPDRKGSGVEKPVPAGSAGGQPDLRARVWNWTRAYPRASCINPAGVGARAAIAGRPARGVRPRPLGGGRS